MREAQTDRTGIRPSGTTESWAKKNFRLHLRLGMRILATVKEMVIRSAREACFSTRFGVRFLPAPALFLPITIT